jgi:ribonuclease HI
MVLYEFELGVAWTKSKKPHTILIDAAEKGNCTRHINHSCCASNCKAEVWWVRGAPRVGVFTTRQVSEGEPLFLDYAQGRREGTGWVCRCGQVGCTGAVEAPEERGTRLMVFTDGAASDGKAGWGYVLIEQVVEEGRPGSGGREIDRASGGVILAEAHPDFKGARKETNNTGEFTAIVEALERVARDRALDGRRVRLITDSSLAVSFLGRTSQPRTNKELVERMLKVADSFGERLDWMHCTSHVGIAWNELADELAREGLGEDLVEPDQAPPILPRASRDQGEGAVRLRDEWLVPGPPRGEVATIVGQSKGGHVRVRWQPEVEDVRKLCEHIQREGVELCTEGDPRRKAALRSFMDGSRGDGGPPPRFRWSILTPAMHWGDTARGGLSGYVAVYQAHLRRTAGDRRRSDAAAFEGERGRREVWEGDVSRSGLSAWLYSRAAAGSEEEAIVFRLLGGVIGSEGSPLALPEGEEMAFRPAYGDRLDDSVTLFQRDSDGSERGFAISDGGLFTAEGILRRAREANYVGFDVAEQHYFLLPTADPQGEGNAVREALLGLRAEMSKWVRQNVKKAPRAAPRPTGPTNDSGRDWVKGGRTRRGGAGDFDGSKKKRAKSAGGAERRSRTSEDRWTGKRRTEDGLPAGLFERAGLPTDAWAGRGRADSH